MTDRCPPYYSVALVSAASLAYEVLLMRLFSIIQWHHMAHLIIGLALLGYGMSGTVITLAQQRLIHRYAASYIASLVFFGLSAPGCYLIAQQIPFNPQELFWHWSQAIYLLILFGLMALPFFFAASAICLTLLGHEHRAGNIYGFDLTGAGLGSLGVVVLLYFVLPQTALIVISMAGFLAAGIGAWELRLRYRLPFTGVMFLLVAVIAATTLPLELKMSPYKSLTQHLRIRGAQVIEERSSPLGLLSVLQNPSIPFRHAPGLSLINHQEPLPQLAVFTDGGNPTVITRQAEHRNQLSYLDQVTSALPYHLMRPNKVLILGAGGGTDVLQARFHNVSAIEAVELNAQIVALLKGPLANFGGDLYNDKTIDVHIGDIRGFVEHTPAHYDLIQLSLTDGFNASAAGLYALNESYLYTVEALAAYLSRLAPDGYLAITRWIKMPPRDTLKLLATAVAALKRNGIGTVADHLVLIRSWQTSTLVIKNQTFTPSEHDRVRKFCEQRSFDVVFGPDVPPEDANRYNQLRRPLFYEAAQALTGDQAAVFMHQYKFNITPATDNRPYFHHFFKWSTFTELWQLRTQGGTALLESGYLVLVVTLLVGGLISVVLILLPLWFFKKEEMTGETVARKKWMILYFVAIGMAFLAIEIASIQRFMQFLHHPVYAITTCLTAFLTFAAWGSFKSRDWAPHRGLYKRLQWTVTAIAVVCLSHVLLLPRLFAAWVDLAMPLKILISVASIAPLAFFMGMPFPLAVSALAGRSQRLIPWAWGANGCASVISASLATLLAIHFGFTMVFGLAVFLYGVAWRLSQAFESVQPDPSIKHRPSVDKP